MYAWVDPHRGPHSAEDHAYESVAVDGNAAARLGTAAKERQEHISKVDAVLHGMWTRVVPWDGGCRAMVGCSASKAASAWRLGMWDGEGNMRTSSVAATMITSPATSSGSHESSWFCLGLSCGLLPCTRTRQGLLVPRPGVLRALSLVAVPTLPKPGGSKHVQPWRHEYQLGAAGYS